MRWHPQILSQSCSKMYLLFYFKLRFCCFYLMMANVLEPRFMFSKCWVGRLDLALPINSSEHSPCAPQSINTGFWAFSPEKSILAWHFCQIAPSQSEARTFLLAWPFQRNLRFETRRTLSQCKGCACWPSRDVVRGGSGVEPQMVGCGGMGGILAFVGGLTLVGRGVLTWRVTTTTTPTTTRDTLYMIPKGSRARPKNRDQHLLFGIFRRAWEKLWTVAKQSDAFSPEKTLLSLWNPHPLFWVSSVRLFCVRWWKSQLQILPRPKAVISCIEEKNSRDLCLTVSMMHFQLLFFF